MADTGENREIRQRVEANQAERVRESKQLVARTKELVGSPKRRPSGQTKGLGKKKKKVE